MVKTIFTTCAATLALVLASTAQAAPVTLNFNSPPANMLNPTGPSYSESGFTLTQVGPPFWLFLDPTTGFTSQFLDYHDHGLANGKYLELTEDNNTNFDLFGFQVRVDSSGGNDSPLRITNNLGGLVDITFNGDTNARIFNFDNTWTDLTWVQFNGNFDITLDNVRLDTEPDTDPTPVPEPASLAIWTALGGMGLLAARRRRRKQQA